MIIIENVTKRYEVNNDVINNVSLLVDEPSFVSIQGVSGSGKSTFLTMVGGINRPTEGRIMYDGIDIYSLSDYKLAKFRNEYIGFVFQKYGLIQELNVIENIELPTLFSRTRRDRDRAREAMDMVGLGKKERKKVSLLSGGEQQRVAIARAIFQAPRILIADEPTGALDFSNKTIVADALKMIHDKYETTILLATHDEQIARRAQKGYILENGILRECG